MVFNNVEEVFDSIEQTRARIYDQVRELSEEQSRFRLADDQWSVVEIAEHVSVAESRILKLVQSLVEQGEAAAAPVDENTVIPPISIESIAAQIPAKAKAPEAFLPTGQLSLEEVIRNLRQTREALVALKPRLQAKDFTPVIFSHEGFGTFTTYQLVAFIGHHEDRHLGQIAALVASEAFPARQAAGA